MQQLFSRNKLLTRVAGAFSPAALGNKLPGFLLSNPKIFKHENKAQTFTRRFAACSKLVVSVFAFLMLFSGSNAQVVSGRVGIFRDSIYVNGKWYNNLSGGGGGGGISGSGTPFYLPMFNSSNSIVNSPVSINSITNNLIVNGIDQGVLEINDDSSNAKVITLGNYHSYFLLKKYKNVVDTFYLPTTSSNGGSIHVGSYFRIFSVLDDSCFFMIKTDTSYTIFLTQNSYSPDFYSSNILGPIGDYGLGQRVFLTSIYIVGPKSIFVGY